MPPPIHVLPVHTPWERRFSYFVFFVVFVALPAAFGTILGKGAWQNYWVIRDGQLVTAKAVQLSGDHGSIIYRYSVNHRTYYGDDMPPNNDRADPPYEVDVHYSKSHPWLSRVTVPTHATNGLWWVKVCVMFAWCWMGWRTFRDWKVGRQYGI